MTGLHWMDSLPLHIPSPFSRTHSAFPPNSRTHFSRSWTHGHPETVFSGPCWMVSISVQTGSPSEGQQVSSGACTETGTARLVFHLLLAGLESTTTTNHSEWLCLVESYLCRNLQITSGLKKNTTFFIIQRIMQKNETSTPICSKIHMNGWFWHYIFHGT